MLDQLLNYIKKQKLFQPEDKVILAVSGGIDSMALVHLFQQTNYDFAIAHCNFKLRGKESDEDQELVETTAKKCNVPFYTKSFHTENHAKKHGISIQMAARDLRQSWFHKLLKKEGYHIVATGHQLNDSLETALFNLVKGTGISGLRGILPKRDIYIRPMMFATRQMIVDYVAKYQITWREDRSNSEVKYHRNLIRHHIIPELKKINPRLEATFSKSMEKIIGAERIYQEKIREEKTKVIENTTDGFSIDKSKLKAFRETEILLFEILENYGFNFPQVKDLVSKMDGQPGKMFFSGEYQLTIDRDYLFVSENPEFYAKVGTIDLDTKDFCSLRSHLTFERVDIQDMAMTTNKNVAFLDCDRLEFPLKVRLWGPGDRFQPLGMKHKKKLSDFMIDAKIPLNLKKHVMVLVSGNELVWVIGHRIDERYKITSETKNVFMVRNKSGNDQSV